jgi:chromate transport protein ChrA
MKILKSLFLLMHMSGLVAIAALFIHVEWRFIHGNLSNALNPLVQLFVVGSMLILPLFWVLLCITVAGYVGKRIIRKKTMQTVADR